MRQLTYQRCRCVNRSVHPLRAAGYPLHRAGILLAAVGLLAGALILESPAVAQSASTANSTTKTAAANQKSDSATLASQFRRRPARSSARYVPMQPRQLTGSKAPSLGLPPRARSTRGVAAASAQSPAPQQVPAPQQAGAYQPPQFTPALKQPVPVAKKTAPATKKLAPATKTPAAAAKSTSAAKSPAKKASPKFLETPPVVKRPVAIKPAATAKAPVVAKKPAAVAAVKKPVPTKAALTKQAPTKRASIAKAAPKQQAKRPAPIPKTRYMAVPVISQPRVAQTPAAPPTVSAAKSYVPPTLPVQASKTVAPASATQPPLWTVPPTDASVAKSKTPVAAVKVAAESTAKGAAPAEPLVAQKPEAAEPLAAAKTPAKTETVKTELATAKPATVAATPAPKPAATSVSPRLAAKVKQRALASAAKLATAAKPASSQATSSQATSSQTASPQAVGPELKQPTLPQPIGTAPKPAAQSTAAQSTATVKVVVPQPAHRDPQPLWQHRSPFAQPANPQPSFTASQPQPRQAFLQPGDVGGPLPPQNGNRPRRLRNVPVEIQQRPSERAAGMPFEVVSSSGELTVTRRRNKILRSRRNVRRVAVVDASICDVIQFTPREVSIIGKAQGATNVTFWFENEESEPVTYLVRVIPDPEVQVERERQYQILEELVAELFPDSKVRLLPVADKLIVRGQAKGAEEAAQIMAVIRGEAVLNNNGIGTAAVVDGEAASPLTDEETGLGIPAANVINMLRIPGVQQVALKVKIAELNRTAARQFGVDLDLNFGSGGESLIIQTLLNMAVGSTTSIAGTFDNDDINFGIHYLQSHDVIRILSEPTLVTLSGRPASFLAGGEFAVPTVVGVDGASGIATDFRSFGVILNFLPTVIDKDRIRLQISPEFSQVDTDLEVNGTPGLNTRAVTTTVEMREGQAFAIAGLLEDSMNSDTVSDIPILPRLLGKRSVSHNETELLILVTPELVHPLEPEEVPPLPGFDVTEPTNCEFFWHGDIEGRPTREYRSTIWPRLRNRYRNGGPAMISGPFGHGQ